MQFVKELYFKHVAVLRVFLIVVFKSKKDFANKNILKV